MGAATRNLNAKLAAGFSPKSATGDVDARFLAWAQTAVDAVDCGDHGHGGGQWVGRHGDMGNGMQFDLPRMLVQSLPIDVESAGFDPTASLCIPERSFLAFARSQTTEVGHREIASPTPFGLCQPTNLCSPQIVSQSPCEDSQDASSGVPPLVLPLALPPPDEKAPAVDDPVPEFLVKWGLDEGSEQLLRSMPDQLMRDVIASFAPPWGTRNLNAKLAAFAAAKQAKSPSVSPKGAIRAKPRSLPASPQASSAAPAGAVKQMEETVHQFTSAWGLDEGAAQMLAELPMDICVGVLTDFDPPPNTQNISARFEAFVRGRLATSSQGFCGNPVGGSQCGDPVTNFVIQWGLDAQSELTLRTLRPKQLAAVLRGFHPAQGTLNINAKFSAFTRSVTSRDAIGSTGSGAGTSIGGSGGKIATVGDADAVASFVSRWGLDADAQQALHSLPDGMRSTVLADFCPPTGTVNISGKFKCFIRARMKHLNFPEMFTVPVGGQKSARTVLRMPSGKLCRACCASASRPQRETNDATASASPTVAILPPLPPMLVPAPLPVEPMASRDVTERVKALNLALIFSVPCAGWKPRSTAASCLGRSVRNVNSDCASRPHWITKLVTGSPDWLPPTGLPQKP